MSPLAKGSIWLSILAETFRSCLGVGINMHQASREFIDTFSLTLHRRTSYNGTTVAGRAVYRRRMGQTRCLELGRSTQLPPSSGGSVKS
jgi:hypothetical protein